MQTKFDDLVFAAFLKLIGSPEATQNTLPSNTANTASTLILPQAANTTMQTLYLSNTAMQSP